MTIQCVGQHQGGGGGRDSHDEEVVVGTGVYVDVGTSTRVGIIPNNKSVLCIANCVYCIKVRKVWDSVNMGKVTQKVMHK